jgi:phage host-nuclease inhibitor protein Gam
MELEEFQLEDGEPDGAWKRDFVINDEDQCLWAMRKLAVSQRRIDTVKRQAQDEEHRIEMWVQQATRSDQATVLYFTEILTSYMLRLRALNGSKSLSLPDGEIKSRETPSRAVVEDLDLFIKWASDSGHSSWVRTKFEADLKAVKQSATPSGEVYTTSDGEVIEGLALVEGSISVTIDIIGKE